MKSLIIQDSYWFLEGEGDSSKMSALCPLCAKKQKKGWKWDKNLGYGDYDLFCSVCKNAIYFRGKVETSDKNNKLSVESCKLDS